MSKINDGGPAFPLQSIGPEFSPGYAGMSLRDYFAAHAPLPECDMPFFEHCAYRYAYADAMLKAREGGEA